MPGPEMLFGDLFATVQTRRIFPDSKTFPDMEPRGEPASIMAAWHAEVPDSDAEIRAFVDRHFTAPPEIEPADLPEGQPLPARIAALWDVLTRQPETHSPYGSALPMPRPYVVPGGRFRETYYWDSYFTMLGLRADGREDLIEAMLENFTSMVERYGHIPNGTRTYYLSRSQPPFLALMYGLSQDLRPELRQRRLDALRREHGYWMQGGRCVRLCDGALLNRYWDDADSPRPESHAEDVETASLSDRPAAQVYRDIRAGAESGWDFSSRWLADGRTMATIRTTEIIPADLNSLLYAAERRIAAECAALGDVEGAIPFAAAAEVRAQAIHHHLWNEAEGRFADLLWAEGRPAEGLSAATLYPLFTGLATQHQADRVAEQTERHLLAPGGLRTTMVDSGEQWDMPNGWAPLQWIAVAGLRRYGRAALADSITERWLRTVTETYAETGLLLEKYDVEQGRPGGGGEYPNQTGFGWTNGVVRAFSEVKRGAKHF